MKENGMIKRLLDFLDASPVNFLAAHNIAESLEQAGYRQVDPSEPIGEVKAGDKLYVTKNDSSVYAFHIGHRQMADAGFHMICAHCDSPTFRIKPNAEMLCVVGSQSKPSVKRWADYYGFFKSHRTNGLHAK